MDTAMSAFNGIILVFVFLSMIGFIISVIALAICLRIFINKDGNGERATIPAVLSAFAYSFTVFNLMLTCILVFFMVFFPKLPNPDYVETGISIEESGYQSERFTVNGVIYTSIDLLANYDYCDSNAAPAFNYHTDGYAQGSFCSGTYHRLENGGGFDLVYHIDSGTLFCPVGERNDVFEYYNSLSNLDWYEYCTYYDDEGNEIGYERTLSESARIALGRLTSTYSALMPTQLTLEDYTYYIFDLYTRSSDNIVEETYCYYIIGTDDGKMYIWVEDISYEDNKTKMLVTEVPADITAMLDELWYY